MKKNRDIYKQLWFMTFKNDFIESSATVDTCVQGKEFNATNLKFHFNLQNM